MNLYILFVCKIIKLVYNLVVPCSLSELMVEFSHTVNHKVSIEFILLYLSPYHIVKPRENPNFLEKKKVKWSFKSKSGIFLDLG